MRHGAWAKETFSNQERGVKGELGGVAKITKAVAELPHSKVEAARPPWRRGPTQARRLMAAGGDGIGGAPEEAVAEAAGAVVGVGHFGYLEEFLAEFAEMESNGFLFFIAADAKVKDVAGFLLRDPTLGTARN